jgi:hypothetical protein
MSSYPFKRLAGKGISTSVLSRRRGLLSSCPSTFVPL